MNFTESSLPKSFLTFLEITMVFLGSSLNFLRNKLNVLKTEFTVKLAKEVSELIEKFSILPGNFVGNFLNFLGFIFGKIVKLPGKS